MIDLYPHRATVNRISKTLTNGEYVPTSASYATNVPLRIEERKGQFRIGALGTALEFDAVAFCPPHAATVRPAREDIAADEIVQATPATNAMYRVLHVIDSDGFNHHRTIYLRALP